MFSKDLIFNNGIVKVRQDEYKHGLYFAVKKDEEISLFDDKRFTVIEKYILENNVLKSTISIKMNEDVKVEKLYLRLGVDTYMEKYPEWNDIYFPTNLTAEKTHFVGYMQSPNGKAFAIASPSCIKTWSLDYCWADYGEIIKDTGHRIYTACLHFINEESIEEDRFVILRKGQELTYNIYYTLLDSIDEVYSFWQEYAKCPLIQSKKWTYEKGEKCDLTSDGVLTIKAPSGKTLNRGDAFEEYGLYTIEAKRQEKITTAKIFVRKSFDEYLKYAFECATKCEQRPSTHAETYYGYFALFSYLLHNKDNRLLNRVAKEFDKFLVVLLNEERTDLCADAIPFRIQNTSTVISLLVYAYRVYAEEKYLLQAFPLAERLMEAQAKTGEYLGGKNREHYTCVIYPAKSMLELCDLLREVSGYENQERTYRNSAMRAIEELYINLDNIGTEGQATFEDGMISCEILQLAYAALSDGTLREEYTKSAEILLKKHACLEQNLVLDTRTRGCTLRFWEAMYDVLIWGNLISSPHGWSSWKKYGTFYLYLLTGKVEYLKATMDTLCACLQCFDIQNEKIYWGYVLDPVIRSGIFSCENGKPTLTEKVFGECYIPMISDNWRSDLNSVCWGYAYPTVGFVEGRYKGGCCDNDVFEHIKCLNEVGLNAFIHELENDKYCYNCLEDNNVVSLSSKYLNYLYYYAEESKTINLLNKKIELNKGLNIIRIKEWQE